MSTNVINDQPDDQVLLVFCNVPDLETSKKLALKIVEERLAACVNSLPSVQSTYLWKGSIEQTTEVTLFIKTTGQKYSLLEERLKNLHPYDTPEIIAIKVHKGLPSYLAWVQEVTCGQDNEF